MDVFALTMRLKEEGAAQVKASVDKLNRSFDEASGKAKAYDMTIGSLKDSFSGLAAGFALGAVFSKVIQETSDAAAAAAQLNAVLKSTGEVAGQSADALNKHAQALSFMTAFDDDAITGAQALLLTFTKIQGDVFPKATQAVLDMATAMGTDLKSAAIQVGKALNDPVLGVSALSRAGVQFNEQQKNMIALMVETNNVLGAQDIILAELRTQFEGSAAAAANTLGGAISQLNNELGNLLTLSSNNSSVATTFVQGLTDAIRGLNVVLTDLANRAPGVEGRLSSLFKTVAPYFTSTGFMALAGIGAGERVAAAGGKGFEAVFTVPKGLTALGETGEGTKVPVARAVQIEQLLRLAEVTKLNAAQQALLRSEASRLAEAMRAQNVSIEDQIKLGEKLQAIQGALKTKAVKPLKLAEVTGLGVAFMQQQKLPQIPITLELMPEVVIPPESTTQVKSVFDKLSIDYAQGFQQMVESLAEQMGNALVNSVAGAFENLTSVGGSIKSAFQTLTAGLLAGLGSMLIEFGRYVIIAGKLMAAVRESLRTMNPVAGVAAGLAMIAIGGMLRGAASRAFGGGPTGGGAGVPMMFGPGGGMGGTAGLPTISYGPTMAGRGNTIQQTTPMNITVIGPNDPSAQRQMQELMRNAQRRGEA
jgi:hypothetical protein